MHARTACVCSPTEKKTRNSVRERERKHTSLPLRELSFAGAASPRNDAHVARRKTRFGCDSTLPPPCFTALSFASSPLFWRRNQREGTCRIRREGASPLRLAIHCRPCHVTRRRELRFLPTPSSYYATQSAVEGADISASASATCCVWPTRRQSIGVNVGTRHNGCLALVVCGQCIPLRPLEDRMNDGDKHPKGGGKNVGRLLSKGKHIFFCFSSVLFCFLSDTTNCLRVLPPLSVVARGGAGSKPW